MNKWQRFKCGHGLLIDIGAEAFAVDGTVEHTRGSHTRGSELVAAPGCKEGYGAPFPMARKAA